MNERIEELMIKAGARFEFLHGVNYDDFQYREFARLLIKECGLIADVNLEGSTYPSFLMKQHFGIEE